jgi:Urocanase Rossmann-like domain
LPLDPAPPALNQLMAQVYLNYAALMRYPAARTQDHLGGRLLYAGELDASGNALTIAGNIAGAATLAATADQAGSRQAMREGAVDFVVTTLDEALRILKNQVRKHEPVSVCVGAAPENVEREMLERGVEPDLLPAGGDERSSALAEFIALGARRIELEPLAAGQTLFTVEIPLGSTRESARIEEILTASIAEDDFMNRRWLRFSPRYLGPSARRVRSMVCGTGLATELRKQLGELGC